jgi:hypothetical protein
MVNEDDDPTEPSAQTVFEHAREWNRKGCEQTGSAIYVWQTINDAFAASDEATAETGTQPFRTCLIGAGITSGRSQPS